MRKLFVVGVLAAAICLAGLYLFFNYFQPTPAEEKAVAFADNGEDVPAGYFDLRGIKQVLVDIKDFDFNPRRIVVSPDTEILWKNGDKVFHSVNFDSQPASPSLGGPAGLLSPVPNSPQLKTGELFVQTIHAPGTYTYHSADNPDTMTGIVVVK